MTSEEKWSYGKWTSDEKNGAENRNWFLDHCFKKPMNRILFTKPRTCLNHETNQESLKLNLERGEKCIPLKTLYYEKF